MYIFGDIGNTETKIFLISLNDKIIKKLSIQTKDINQTKLDKLFINFKIVLHLMWGNCCQFGEWFLTDRIF